MGGRRGRVRTTATSVHLLSSFAAVQPQARQPGRQAAPRQCPQRRRLRKFLPPEIDRQQTRGAAGAAHADRKVVNDHLAAAAGENPRTIDSARALLLASASGEPSDPAALWEHSARDRGVTVASGMRRAEERSNFRLRCCLGGSLPLRSGKGSFPSITSLARREPGPFRRRLEDRGPMPWRNPLRRELFRPIRELE